MMFDAILAETITLVGHGNTEISAYLARPMGPGPYPGVVVTHHRPGYDEASKQIVQRFANHGFLAVMPNLHHREAPQASPAEASEAAKAAGGVPDDRCVGDLSAGKDYVRRLPASNGKVGVIGYCSGGRQTFIAACQTDFDAAIACYGGNIVVGPDELTERQPVAPIDMTPDLGCPLLAMFGAQDKNPSPAHRERIEAELAKQSQPYETKVYDAGHGFFATDRASYRPAAAEEGWADVWRWFGKYLTT
jgi:carboxymethylenebutenolidase